MADTTTLHESIRAHIDGSESVRLATPGANWRATLASIFAELGSPPGPQGPPGQTGPQGAQGATGPQGPSGIVSGVPDPLSLTQGLFLNIPTLIPQAGATFSEAVGIQLPTVSAANLTPTFNDVVGIGIQFTYQNGDNCYGNNSNGFGFASAKSTVLPISIAGTYYGAGQKFGQASFLSMYGMGDSFLQSRFMQFYGGNIGGDEGVGYSTVSSYITQGVTHALSDVVGVARTTLNTTSTQAITGSQNPQTITVASATGANVGDWIVVNQYPIDNNVVMEAVQLTAVNVGGNTITGVFRYSYNSGVPITPALVLSVDNLQQFGQQRVLINLSGATYTTGTFTGNSGGFLIGSGGTWTNGMVGGNAANIGAIALDKDTCSSGPYTNAPLLNWYQIISVSGAAGLSIFSNSTAGDASYRGVGTFPSTYTIRPAARILYIDFINGRCICETSTHTWNNGDLIECVMCPYPDVSGDSLNVACYSTGGTYRSFFGIINSGARTFEIGLNISGPYNPTLSGNGDEWGFGIGIQIYGAQYGIIFEQSQVCIALTETVAATIIQAGNGATFSQLATPVNGFSFGNFINIVAGTGGGPDGMSLRSTGSPNTAPAAVLDVNLGSATHKALVITPAGSQSANLVEISTVSGADAGGRLFSSVVTLTPGVFGSLPGGSKGMLACITDSTTNTAGATIAGSGSNSVIGWYNGTNWIVMGTH